MYIKKLYVFDGDLPVEAAIRRYTMSDCEAMIRIQRESFPPPFPPELWWNEAQLRNHVSLFPEGALCVEIGGELVGSITGLRVNFDPEHAEHNWQEITDHGSIRNHIPDGDTLYIVDVCISPAYRKLGLGKWLMQSMYEVVVQLGMKRLLGGGRMPGYHRCASEMTAAEYVGAVVSGERKDPVISFLLRCGRTPVQVVPDYLEDEESCNYALLMEWRNPFLI
ncbi:GNAT family N-acetyltransferase [Paenibacillus eucommiae]|uniref:Ribosomal protein S18 acetylase RimI-like enzyme n=1 Tax=Paenibacillus eucommiae TaxID=1355755 RepID=A0ABS4J897_9BACL|nr:GNAT family N-acetyltransferase [Paenibacillus eucommiae]MBP1996030.1 ribosomal protein S18 acetylase RimI-like enzyme [Paenibacillus eucommiae]